MSERVLGEGSALVGICMGSDSDWSTMQAASEVLDEFSVPHRVDVLSAHRMPTEMLDYGKQARSAGLRVIIAGPGVLPTCPACSPRSPRSR